ncbi:tyrosinase family protein [Aurantimonas sp. VKM B-3413]|uniref:tyrosinase family protein n=1 Tax=Aurantimonas sp. VKM B-3413 TaxID=2779401 RepID=UPI001E4724B0|nr:tyrosinase family protein [Aurantimonas sp. VKM B-3413]MCB8838293.1 tyrosinase family protein [Aurantimonas sp. VKM B-3413]
MDMSRRTVLKAVASLTLVTVLPASFEELANAQPLRVRHDARSPEGKRMLATYAKAVKTMKESGTGTPASWTFQWYTHAVSGSSSKLAELNRIYGSRPSPDRDLANLTWSTCQAHGGNTWEPNFLPWHRAYILFFEDTIRKVTRDESFTLPYWNYTEDASIPEEFRRKNDPVYGALYQANRNPGINDGLPLTRVKGGLPANLLSLDVMDAGSYYSGPQGVPLGFNERIDSSLHGFIHVNTGGTQNMGSVPFAAQDPIFYIHHCNIDRIWAGWNANGGHNPTAAQWASRQVHVFADAAGRRVEVTNGQVTAIAPLGYTYDALPRPQVAVASREVASTSTESLSGASAVNSMIDGGGGGTQVAQAAEIQADMMATTQQPLVLESSPTAVTLTPAKTGASLESFSTELKNSPKRQYLVLSGIKTDVQPGTIYNVFAGEPGAQPAATDSPAYVGSLQFFDAQPLSDGGSTKQIRFVFDITSQIQSGVITNPLSYYIVPADHPEQGARPVVGTIELVNQ